MTPLDDLKDDLADYSRDDLLRLISEMLEQHPDLQSRLKRHHQKHSKKSTTLSQATHLLDFSRQSRQINRALQRDDMDDIAADLEEVHSEATQLLQSGDWLNAGRLDQILLNEITDSYDDEMREIDYDGAIASVSQDAAEGLGNCLAKATSLDATTRSHWLNTLLEAFLKDLELGGIDYGAGAEEPILQQATEAEWAAIEAQLRDQLGGQSDRWRNEAIVSFLAERQSLMGQSAEASRIIDELGSPEQKAFLRVEEGKLTEAVAIANQHFSHQPGLVTQFADALLEAKAPEVALQLVNEQEQQHSNWGYREWLADYHLQYSPPQTALDAHLRRFMENPTLARYQTIKQLAQQVGTWSEVESQLLKDLEPTQHQAVLIEIALDEQDLDRALALLPKLTGWGVSIYLSRVAQAAEKPRPQTAIDLYQRMVAEYIAQKSRSSYQSAVQILKQVQPLYNALNNRVGWTAYLENLRTQFKYLPALQDELRKAKL
jgi:hypothetical protein